MQLAMKEIDSILDSVNIIEEKLQCTIIEAYYDELVDDFCLKMEFLKDGSKIKSWKRYDVHTLKNIVFPEIA
ncbi:hypothetical protein EI427_22030 [Flammeovirga pectinis]|uniref:Uncharacterized protein n=1 Tax=Flammeovirga pectinis TaxID=2494373 RepID=A0A3Q9FTU4_9BACT|nr:hypothetical protein [Flammeovirga pectinis]AZQ64908.1 hypothetical protein EI427_22030 [Flammeovirga pectinis]